MENDLNTQFVCAFHEVNEDEIDNEKKAIKKYNEQDNSLNLTFKNMYFPIFQYERIRLPNGGNGPLPYGECFTTAFNEEATLLACGYSNGHVNIFNLTEKKTQ
jgi:hypothetical protein